ncbi:hypothetical protein [Streptacidiphilus sp. PAMC 29251]
MGKLTLRRRGTVIAALAVTGVLVAGGATASAATSTTTAKATTTTAKAKHKQAHRHAPRGVHGQRTVKNVKTGQYVTREWQRGQVTAVSGTTVTVKSADGTSWAWNADPKLKITRDGKKTTESVLKSGDTVLVEGTQAGTKNDAIRIFAPSAAQLAKRKAAK